MFFPIETRRLLIRPFEDKDLKDIEEYSSASDFWLLRSLAWEPTRESIRKYWDSKHYFEATSNHDHYDLVIEWKEKGLVIGNIGIWISGTQENKQGTIAWLLGNKFQGQGLASEAAKALISFGFDTLNLHRISARTSRDNIRSWLLMERIGMRREAHFKQSDLVNGEWQDEFIYAVLDEEWHSKH